MCVVLAARVPGNPLAVDPGKGPACEIFIARTVVEYTINKGKNQSTVPRTRRLIGKLLWPSKERGVDILNQSIWYPVEKQSEFYYMVSS